MLQVGQSTCAGRVSCVGEGQLQLLRQGARTRVGWPILFGRRPTRRVSKFGHVDSCPAASQVRTKNVLFAGFSLPHHSQYAPSALKHAYELNRCRGMQGAEVKEEVHGTERLESNSRRRRATSGTSSRTSSGTSSSSSSSSSSSESEDGEAEFYYEEEEFYFSPRRHHGRGRHGGRSGRGRGGFGPRGSFKGRPHYQMAHPPPFYGPDMGGRGGYAAYGPPPATPANVGIVFSCATCMPGHCQHAGWKQHHQQPGQFRQWEMPRTSATPSFDFIDITAFTQGPAARGYGHGGMVTSGLGFGSAPPCPGCGSVKCVCTPAATGFNYGPLGAGYMQYAPPPGPPPPQAQAYRGAAPQPAPYAAPVCTCAPTQCTLHQKMPSRRQAVRGQKAAPARRRRHDQDVTMEDLEDAEFVGVEFEFDELELDDDDLAGPSNSAGLPRRGRRGGGGRFGGKGKKSKTAKKGKGKEKHVCSGPGCCA